MALEHPFPRYPNYSFLQLEEINSMISLFTNGGFEDISCISTDVIAPLKDTAVFPAASTGKPFASVTAALQLLFPL